MHMVIPLPAACRAVIPRPLDEPLAPRSKAHRQPIPRGTSELPLLFGTLATVLGLAMVTMSLMPFADKAGGPGQPWPRSGLVRAVASTVPVRGNGHALAQPLAMPMDLAGQSTSTAFPTASATGPWTSPLYPQNGVTLWDRIRVSSKRDRRAFLLGTAIQIHDPATAATPGPRSAPQCCPRS